MPPIIPDRFREEERTSRNFKLVVMLQSHNRESMIFLHCSDADPLGLYAKVRSFPAHPGL